MRLLVVLPEYLPQEGGGLITFYRHLLPEMVRQGHEVSVLVGSGVTQGDFTATIEGVHVSFLRPDRFRTMQVRFEHLRATPLLARHLAAAWALWEQAGAGQGFDVVETTDWGMLFVPWLVEGSSPPTVVQLHGSIGQIGRHDPTRGAELEALVARALEGAVLVHAPELQTYSGANARFWLCELGRSPVVIRPACRFGAVGEPNALPGPSVVAVGRIQRWKGPDVLCEALRRMPLASRPATVWVGRDMPDGESGSSYEKALARRYPDIWRQYVRPLGQLSFAATADLQRQARVVVVPSQWDVFNFTVVEGMAAGVPVVCSDGAGAVELLTDGEDGFVSKAGDAEHMAATLQKALDLSPEKRREISATARATVARELDPARICGERLARLGSLAGVFKRQQIPHSVTETFQPGGETIDPYAFLHHVPMRTLLRHALHRLAARLVH